MTTLTLPFTEGFNTIAGKIRQLGGKFITTGTGTTRTLVFSNMPESVLSLIWNSIEKENATPETDAESAGVRETETPETMEVEAEQIEPVATDPVEESVDSPRRRYEESELEELTKNEILDLAERLEIDMKPVFKKRKPEMIAPDRGTSELEALPTQALSFSR